MEQNNHKPVLIVIAGPNGSGKTTVTSKILKHEWMEDAVYINPDIIAQEIFGDWNSVNAIHQSIEYVETHGRASHKYNTKGRQQSIRLYEFLFGKISVD